MPSFSLGAIDVPAAGTIVQVSTDTNLRASSITFQAKPTNAGAYAYVGLSTLVASTFVGCLAVLGQGDSLTINSGARNPIGLRLSDYYVDVTTSGDDVIVSYTTS